MPVPAPPPAAQYAPVVAHDARETSVLTSVADVAVSVPGVPASAPPTVYARRAGQFEQYWLFFADNPQDRGIVHTGRHEGDWELVQLEFSEEGEPVSVVASQHSGAERCAWAEVAREGSRPVIFAANGSHALYFAAGTRDRTWPDPNDEARGDGERVAARVEPVGADSPAWMAWPGRWGASRASWVPGESDSPRGPAFQGVRWNDPAAFAASARPCAAARPPVNRLETAMTVIALVLVLAFSGWRARSWCGRWRP